MGVFLYLCILYDKEFAIRRFKTICDKTEILLKIKMR